MLRAAPLWGELITAAPDSTQASAEETRPADSASAAHAASRPPVAGRNDTAHIVALDKMVVTASRRQRLLEASQSLAIIRPNEWAGTNKSVADVVAEQTGVQTRRYGGTGSFQTVSIRGVQGSEVLVLLDGIPLNSAMGGAVDLGSINAERVGEIELYKGITPARFGGNNLGGVVNIKSTSATKGQLVDIKTSFGGFGYDKHSVGISHSYNEKVRLYASLDYLQSDNNWPYRSDNRTPKNKTDDTDEELVNDYVKNVDLRLQPSIDLANGGMFSTALSYSSMDKGLPAGKAHINPTAKVPKEQLYLTARLIPPESKKDVSITFAPEISYYRFVHKTFWTSLDQDMGTSHGSVSSAPNSFAEYKTVEQSVNASCVADLVLSDHITGEIALGGKHGEIATATRSTAFTHGDWPGESQEISLSSDIDGALPLGIVSLGATAGGSAKAVRNATAGGSNHLLEMDVSPKDTIEFSFAGRGGIHVRIGGRLNVFANAGRYTDIPKLRERYGTSGAVIANPLLKKEKGTTFELGGRLWVKPFFAEAVYFRSKMEDGIVLLSDGTLTKPVNLAKSRTQGFETVVSATVLSMLGLEARSTLQRAVNLAVNYNGRRLPNEPDLALLGKASLEPVTGLTFAYWLEYKSAFYRDYGNVYRMPEDGSMAGIALHNAQMTWKSPWNVTMDFSIRNVNGALLRADQLVYYEAGYEWTLYPSNEWCITAGYSF